MPRITAIYILSALISLPVSAQVNPQKLSPQGQVQSDLERAARWVREDLEFEKAVSLLERLLSKNTLQTNERIEAYGLLAIAYIAQGQTDSAETAFGALLKLDPDHRIDPLLSPKIREVFVRVKSQVIHPVRLFGLNAERQGEVLRLRVRIQDPDQRLTRLLLRYRGPHHAYRTAHFELQTNGKARRGELALPYPDETLDYHLIGYDQAGHHVAALGRSDSPYRLFVQRVEDEKAWHQRWWTWAIAAGAVVGTVAAIAIVRSQDEELPEGSLGTLVF